MNFRLEYALNFMDGWLEAESEEVLRNWRIVRDAALLGDASPTAELIAAAQEYGPSLARDLTLPANLDAALKARDRLNSAIAKVQP